MTPYPLLLGSTRLLNFGNLSNLPIFSLLYAYPFSRKCLPYPFIRHISTLPVYLIFKNIPLYPLIRVYPFIRHLRVGSFTVNLQSFNWIHAALYALIIWLISGHGNSSYYLNFWTFGGCYYNWDVLLTKVCYCSRLYGMNNWMNTKVFQQNSVSLNYSDWPIL